MPPTTGSRRTGERRGYAIPRSPRAEVGRFDRCGACDPLLTFSLDTPNPQPRSDGGTIMTVKDDQTTKDIVSDEGELDGLRVLPVEGSDLTYQVSGDGPPVLLIHGVLGVLEVWADIRDALATTHQIISYDRRGHGRSPNGTPDVRVHARDAAELIERVAGEPAIVVGWSGGANVAMELIRAHPEQVGAAILVEPGFHGFPGPRLVLKLHLQWLRGHDRAAAEALGRYFFARRSGGNGWDEIDDGRRELLLGDAEGLRGELRPLHRFGLSLFHIIGKEVADWSVPMTYLIGRDTVQMLEKCHGRLTSAAPQIRTVEVPGACHLIPWEQPDAVVHAVHSAVPA
ncbi:MAG: alpha/beta fold hydrolase [Chloroflexi bacterium]|nr:alpha/beta fold hydrolase [Chloroflexota bacterium]